MGLGPLKPSISEGSGSPVRRSLLLGYSHDRNLCSSFSTASQLYWADPTPATTFLPGCGQRDAFFAGKGSPSPGHGVACF